MFGTNVFSPASLRPILFSLALALLLCGNAVAQCDSLTNGSFNVATNWSCGYVPGSTNTVRIYHKITSTTDVGVDSLDIFPGGTLVMDGFPLEIEILTMVVHPGGLLAPARRLSSTLRKGNTSRPSGTVVAIMLQVEQVDHVLGDPTEGQLLAAHRRGE